MTVTYTHKYREREREREGGGGERGPEREKIGYLKFLIVMIV